MSPMGDMAGLIRTFAAPQLPADLNCRTKGAVEAAVVDMSAVRQHLSAVPDVACHRIGTTG